MHRSFFVSRGISQRNYNAFTLTEMLVVMAIIALLAAITTPALQSLTSAQSVDSAANSLSMSLDAARSYAMAHQTYVRVAISKPDSVTVAGVPSLVVLFLSSADGTLNSESVSDMENQADWPQLDKAMILKNFQLYDSVNSATPDTSGDPTPSQSNVGNPTGTTPVAITLNVPSLGAVTFNEYIEFSPNGEAGVLENQPSRYIKLSVDQSRGRSKNPFIVRLSGIAGATSVLRAENL